MGIFFAYDNQATKDGSGAQVQRIFAIYSIAKIIGVKYTNEEILDIDFNPGDGINTHEEMREYVGKLNSYLSFLKLEKPVDPVMKKIKFLYTFKFLIFDRIFFSIKKLQSQITGRDYLYLVTNPYAFIERYPQAYNHLKVIIPKNISELKQEKISIQLHLSRAKTSETNMPERFTPDIWYKTIIDKLISEISFAGKEYEILIHTDVSAEKIWNVPTGANKETLKFWKSSGILDAEGRIELQDSSAISGFNGYKNLSIVSNIDPISAWQIMSKADFLLLGKSSFSFVGALLNSHGVVISPIFWHKGPESWIVIENNTDINEHSFEL